MAPSQVHAVDSLQALVCAKNLSSGKSSDLLIASGLIHLFVVSGSHLSLIKKFLTFIFQKLCNNRIENSWFAQIIILGILFFYCALCDFNPPILRSFVSYAFFSLLHLTQLRWKTENTTLIAGLCCLILSPPWVNSVSLQMSWLAALTLIIIHRCYQNTSMLFQTSLFYVQLLTTYNFIGIPSLLSIGVSTVLTPLLEFFLFPLALIVFILPQLGWLFDHFINVLYFILEHLELHIIFRPYQSEQLIFFNWLLIFGLHLFLLFLPRQRSHAN
jgi:competence protein ComEC